MPPNVSIPCGRESRLLTGLAATGTLGLGKISHFFVCRSCSMLLSVLSLYTRCCSPSYRAVHNKESSSHNVYGARVRNPGVMD